MRQRDIRLDSIKGLLIILVVLGHLIGHNHEDVINERISIFIYTFHMPLFVLLSGYFSRIKNDRISLRNDILKLAMPLCIFQAINALLLYIGGGQNRDFHAFCSILDIVVFAESHILESNTGIYTRKVVENPRSLLIDSNNYFYFLWFDTITWQNTVNSTDV